ncbi:division/cell wall cluster transcriptional repressor MraZ [Derxia gummosa]|uniref:Transcriptional regulator MraZ n=1 Tax=Derxia gummosa DSM 723 TaxID=1121388 RepID=A0A8B6X246_9BURK|nr:division/cell wall cluster transcriptional repressor MraZ [Derxia gummosa]
MFQGNSALTLDAKGRLSVPSRYRDALNALGGGQITITRSPDRCLLIYPRPTWEAKRVEIAAFPASARGFQRLLLGNAQEVELDGAGRALVSPEHRQFAKLEREVILLGMGQYFELWDRASHDAAEEATVAAGIPESIGDFSF